MSEIAPFVAAVLRDKAMEDLMKELERQKAMMKDTMKVQITGANGTPVYADGYFDEGDYNRWMNGWVPSLKVHSDCPLTDLLLVEVRLGGVEQFSLNEEENSLAYYLSFLGDRSTELPKNVLVVSGDCSELRFAVNGWKESDWRPRYDQECDNEDDAEETGSEYFLSLPYVDECTVTFESLVFNAKKYGALILKVPRSKEQQIETQRRMQQSKENNAKIQEIEARINAETNSNEHMFSGIMTFMDCSLEIEDMNEEFEYVLPHIATFYRRFEATLTRATRFDPANQIEDIVGDQLFPLAKNAPNRKEILDQVVAVCKYMSTQPLPDTETVVDDEDMDE